MLKSLKNFSVFMGSLILGSFVFAGSSSAIILAVMLYSLYSSVNDSDKEEATKVIDSSKKEDSVSDSKNVAPPDLSNDNEDNNKNKKSWHQRHFAYDRATEGFDYTERYDDTYSQPYEDKDGDGIPNQYDTFDDRPDVGSSSGVHGNFYQSPYA